MRASYYRKQLNKYLATAAPEGFSQLVWAAHTLQTKFYQNATDHFEPESVGRLDIQPAPGSPHAIYPWELETLINEEMTIPKKKWRKNGMVRSLNYKNLVAIKTCINLLRGLEDKEYKQFSRRREDIRFEPGRIAARQFDWQRGFFNVQNVYRSIFVYGQGACAEYFEEEYGLPIEDFLHVGFALYAHLRTEPTTSVDQLADALGLPTNDVKKTLALICSSYPKMRSEALSQRRAAMPTANKPSILRKYPCIDFSGDRSRIRAPLPELIIERVTTGVYYDIVQGQGAVRNDYGRQFERYCFQLLETSLPGFQWRQEYSYRLQRQEFLSPDILCTLDDEIRLIFECKATRMSQVAMFGRNPHLERGYEDLSKAVFQLWRFFSHCRREPAKGIVSKDSIGLVLTLDNWLVLSTPLQEKVIEDARLMAADRDTEITDADMKPIVFVNCSELERCLSYASEELFLRTVTQAHSPQYFGWRPDGILDDIREDCTERKQYPFAEQLQERLPWLPERLDH